MQRTIDPAAYEQVMRDWVLPPCLHIPIVAVSEAAICAHIGDIVEVISPGRALLVAVDPPAPRDDRLPIWGHPNVQNLFEPLQVWVNPRYTRYRQAHRRALPNIDLHGKVLHHIYNRRIATLRGFEYMRIVPVSRRTNSSSSFTEQWGVAFNTPDRLARIAKRGLRMEYADLSAIMVMMDISIGGGVMEVVRVGQDLVEVPGVRPPQG